MSLQQPKTIETLNPEYIKLQREEVVKKYQDQIVELKEEIGVLEGKKTLLTSTLDVAFKERLSLVESRENRLKQSEKETSEGISDLNSRKEAFLKEKDDNWVTLENKKKELHTEIKKNESILSAIKEESVRVEEAKKKIDSYGLLTAGQETKNTTEAARLESEKNKLSGEIGRLEALKSSVESEKKDIESQRQALAIQQNSAHQEVQELNGIREALKKEQEKNEESISNLKVESGKNNNTLTLNNEILKDIKVREQAIKDNENKFKIWEQSSKAEMANKTRDLDEREVRIKKLESQAGGK